MRAGVNQLAVTLAAGEQAAAAFSERLGERPYLSAHPFNAIRKMASNYGWDWGPALITAGIWRPLSLHSWSTARIATVRPLVEVDGSTGLVHAHVEVERVDGDDRALELEVTVGEETVAATVPAGATGTVVEVSVPDAELWWPRGYGGQPLYPVSVRLFAGAEELDDWQGRVGFREVTLEATPDAEGTPFTLAVNGSRVFARGVNWIPDDCFPARLTRQRYAERLTQAVEANVNLVRVWGGGIYESDDFYDVCDEQGLLVWQDFLFACAAYARKSRCARR